MEKEATGIVFNVQNYTVHDGPGIRTELFLKGCTLGCLWCSNPEGLSPKRELHIEVKRCIGTEVCGLCHKACPQTEQGIFQLDHGFVKGVDRSLCRTCFRCAEACPSNAIKVWGEEMTVSKALTLIEKDRSLYQRSGGGVTISGGESLYQHEFVLELLKRCRRSGIHTCVETALNCPAEWVEAILPHVDMMISDIKHMDSKKHREYTGAGNELIHSNLKKITDAGIPLILRIPVIPQHNDSPENIAATADFILDILGNRILQLQLLRFRKIGEEKYASLGIPYPMEAFTPPERDVFEERMRQIADYFVSRGIPAIAGTTEKPKTT